MDKKAAAYLNYLDSTAYRLWDAAANLWSASFFWTADLGDDPPITSNYHNARWKAEQYRAADVFDENTARFLESPQVRAATEAARSLEHFHWPLRFPEIAERGGFDFVTGNPPWEQYELERKEWFATRDTAIANAATSPAIDLLAVLENEDPLLAQEWRLASAANSRQASFMRHSGRYTRSGGKQNTYLLFAETNARIVRENGRAAYIVKSGLGLDLGGQALFQSLVAEGRVEGFYDIVNGGRGEAVIFEGVAEVERFAVLSLGPSNSKAGLPVSMMNQSISEARIRRPRWVEREQLVTLNPVTRSLPSFREPEHWEIALRLHRCHPTLDFDAPSMAEVKSGVRIKPENPWDLKYSTLFNSSSDSRHFMRPEHLEEEGWKLGNDMIYRRDDEEALPLYEGQLVNRYDHRARTYAGCPLTKKYGRKPGISYSTDEQKSDTYYESEPRYWVLREATEHRISMRIGDRLMVGIRDVSRPSTDSRTAKAALLPRRPATDKLAILGVGVNPLELLAYCNSTTFDFLVRGKMPGSGVALVWLLNQIACPLPIGNATIQKMASDLSATSNTVACRLERKPSLWDPGERYQLDTELDARIAHLYGLTRIEYAVVLDSFDVLARKEIAAHGWYRFKEDCLREYRRLG